MVAVGTSDGFLTLWDVTNRSVLAMVCHSLTHSAVRSVSMCAAVASALPLEAVAPSRPLFSGPHGRGCPMHPGTAKTAGSLPRKGGGSPPRPPPPTRGVPPTRVPHPVASPCPFPFCFAPCPRPLSAASVPCVHAPFPLDGLTPPPPSPLPSSVPPIHLSQWCRTRVSFSPLLPGARLAS